ncbi:MAG: CRISPR system precrRNA processing endoribonuclease RAMP protein Cas6 [Gammaproteobacteria bacterium]
MLTESPFSPFRPFSRQSEPSAKPPQCIAEGEFRLACFVFRLRFSDAVELPPYKGALFHGALGRALEQIGAGFRDYFYNPRPPPHWQYPEQAPPRPYALIPPPDEHTRYRPGDSLELGIILYGDAIGHFMIVFAALQHLGERLGLGASRGRFAIEEVLQLGLDAPVALYRNGQWRGMPQTLSAAMFFDTPLPDPGRIALQHATRLRLKAGNELLREPPPFALLLDRLLGRINTLAAMYCGGILIAPDDKQRLHVPAESVYIERSTLQWRDWQRYSQRSGATMPFGGLLGETVYGGELEAFLPWLNLGQWTGVGGKTSFGLGFYQLEIIDADT